VSQLLTYFNESFPTNPAGVANLTGNLAVDAYENVNLEIVSVPGTPTNITVVCIMGVSGLGNFGNNTLSAIVGQFALGEFDTVIHTFPVTAPQFTVQLTGAPANSNVTVQAWIFLK
jgi:hypothetical protein